ncbi:hypothetical protein SAMD00019534_012990, partial [Acytostelium subglobosum LB1]|uniref:hypothetical protein n=1 Tax=Acytostelium subglobosum LB1 TaxID=1410327 RepID=UPI000645137E
SNKHIMNGGNEYAPFNRDHRQSVSYSTEQGQQAVQQNVLREVYKQFELLLLKKKAGDQKVTLRQGLLVSIPQVEKVSSMNSVQVTHQLEVMSNVLVKISSESLHAVCEVLIKMCDTYLDDPYNMVSQSDKKGKIELPSYAKDDIESDLEIVLAHSTSDSLSGHVLTTTLTREQQQQGATTPTLLSPPTPNTHTHSHSHSHSLSSSSSHGSLGMYSSSNNLLSSPPGSGAASAAATHSPAAEVEQPKQEYTYQALQPFNTYAQVSDDTPLYHLLNTLYLILSSHAPTRDDTELDARSQLATLPPKVITFFFNLLQFTQSPRIRYRAASCLQVISLASLDTISQLFITRLQSARNDDFYREYSTFQRAAKYLEFGFCRANQADGTSQYFAKMLIEMEKASRAVFMQAILFTIMRAWPRMFSNPLSRARVPAPFWNVATKIYELVLKWTKKSKLKQLCVRTLAIMCCASEDVVLARSGDLLSLIGNSLKETKTKRPYLEALVTHFNGLKGLFGSEAKAPFYQAQVEMILPFILPKKSSPSDLVLLLEVLLSMGRFSLSIVVSKYILGVLAPSMPGKPPEYSLESKAVVLKMLSSLNTEFPEAMRAYDRTLWQTLDVVFSTYDGDSTPMKYILLNFPSLCSPESQKDIGDKITKWTWHLDGEVAMMATIGIVKYLFNQPQQTFPSILFQMLTYITNYFGEIASLSKVVKNICMVIEEFIALHYLPNGERKCSPQIEPTMWKNLRETSEGVALYLLSSNVTSLWPQVLEFIQLTGHEIFREIDRADNVAYLADYLPHRTFSSLPSKPPHLDLDSVEYNCFDTLIPALNPDLAYFLQIHNGNLQGSVNWAWTRLRKRWHPKSQPIGWKNNLAFLLLSLRLNTQSPEITAVEDQLLTEVMTSYFQEREGKTGEEMSYMISELSRYIHQSCYDTVFRFVEQERGRDLKKKKKEVFYVQEHVIVYISQLSARITVADYDGTTSIRAALREVTYFWITNVQVFQSMPAIVRNHCANLFKHFLALDSKSTIPKSEISLNKASYTKLIFLCLQRLGAMTNEDTIEGELELNIQRAFNLLVSESCLDDYKLDIVGFLIKCLGYGIHLHQLIAESMAIFLRRTPSYLDEFIERSFDNEKQQLASFTFLRALVINFTQHYSSWAHDCPPERLVHLCLFHMVSSNAEARKLACTLSNTLGQQSEDGQFMLFNSHQLTIPTESVPNYVYSRMALLYSNSISNKYPWMTPLLFEEADRQFQHLPFNHKQLQLTLLAPWARNFYWVVTGGEGTLTAKSLENMLDSLLNISIQARTNPNMHTALEVLWSELASSGDSTGPTGTYNVYKRVIDFLKERYHSEKFQPETKHTCKMAICFISRRSSSHWTSVMEYLMKSLRHYSLLPPSPIQFVQEFLNNAENQAKDEHISARSEEAYMYFLEDMTFEFQLKDVLSIPKLVPMLLVNAVLVFGPFSRTDKSIGKRIVDNILYSLVIQQPTIGDDIKDEAMQLVTSDWVTWREKERIQFIRVLQTALGDNIMEMWEQMVLQLAIRCSDLPVSLSAFDWYQDIRTTIGTKKDGMDGLLGLCCGLWRACIMGNVEKMYKTLGVLNAIIANGTRCINSDTSYSIIVRLGSILLHTSYLSQFNSALTLLNRTTHSLSGTPALKARITEEMIDILGAGMKTEQVVNRGIGHPQTALLTLWFAKECAQFSEQRKHRVQPSSIITTVLLTASCMASMSPQDPLTLDFMDYLLDSPSQQLNAHLDLLHEHYRFVSKSISQPPCTTEEFIGLICQHFYEAFADTTPDLLSNLIRSVTELVTSLMDSSREKDASFLLSFIKEMIKIMSGSSAIIQPTYLVEFITVIIEVCQRSSSAFTRANAQNLIPFIMDNLPPGLQVGVFDFVKPFTNGFDSSVSSMFGFQTEVDSVSNLYTSLYLINTYIFAVPADSALNIQMKRILETFHKDRQSSSILPTITTPFTPTIKRKHNVPAATTPTKPALVSNETSKAVYTPPPPSQPVQQPVQQQAPVQLPPQPKQAPPQTPPVVQQPPPPQPSQPPTLPQKPSGSLLFKKPPPPTHAPPPPTSQPPQPQPQQQAPPPTPQVVVQTPPPTTQPTPPSGAGGSAFFKKPPPPAIRRESSGLSPQTQSPPITSTTPLQTSTTPSTPSPPVSSPSPMRPPSGPPPQPGHRREPSNSGQPLPPPPAQQQQQQPQQPPALPPKTTPLFAAPPNRPPPQPGSGHQRTPSNTSGAAPPEQQQQQST